LKSGAAAVEFILLNERIEINLDLRSILVCVDFEVAEFASLAAERDVNIKAERIVYPRRFVQRRERFTDSLGLPLGKRRIV
jgi:hypothetical protein